MPRHVKVNQNRSNCHSDFQISVRNQCCHPELVTFHPKWKGKVMFVSMPFVRETHDLT